MKRLAVAVAAVIGVLAIHLSVGAQVVPGDAGAGVQRGVQELNNSGQVGDITLFGRGGQTRVVLTLKGGAGSEPAHLHRGKACDQPIDPKPAYGLANVVSGRSSTTVNATIDKLLSGNYVVIVHSASNVNHYVACGQLYQA